MELNRTYEAIRDVMQDQPHAVLKTSARGDRVEVAFISPDVGARYRHLLDEVEELTGWTVTLRPHADQHRIKELAQALIPNGHPAARVPQFIASAKLVRIRVEGELPEGDAQAQASAALEEQTGHRLEFYV